MSEFIPTPHKTAEQFYTPDKAAQILDYYLSGKTLADIARMPEMPAYNTLWHWMVSHPEFKEKIQAIREIRAIQFEEKALEAGTAYPSKDEVSSARLAFDTYKWMAEVNDPARYTKKGGGETSGPQIAVYIHTGFPPLTPEQRQPLIGKDGIIDRSLTHAPTPQPPENKE